MERIGDYGSMESIAFDRISIFRFTIRVTGSVVPVTKSNVTGAVLDQ